MSDLEPVLDSRRLGARARKVLQELVLFRGTGEIFRSDDRLAHGERIIMPLAADDPSDTGILGATVYEVTRMGDRKADSHEVEEWYPLSEA